MTPRSIRRAAERKQMKAARKADKSLAPDTTVREERSHREVLAEGLCWNPEPLHDSPVEPLLFTPTPLSPAQLAAHRANAQLSTGPATAEGRGKSSLNAVKTALTGRTVLLTSDDAAAYEAHLHAYIDDFHPVGARESDLVQSIADTAWRLKRIPCLEAAIFAEGHIEFAAAFSDHAAELRPGMIEVQTFIKYEKQLRNLQLQESRLARRREKELAELRQLQQERRSREAEAIETVARRYLTAKATGQPFEPSANGFVFSTTQIEQHLDQLEARHRSPRQMGQAA